MNSTLITILFIFSFSVLAESHTKKCISYCNSYDGKEELKSHQIKVNIKTLDNISNACTIPFYLGSINNDVPNVLNLPFKNVYQIEDGNVGMVVSSLNAITELCSSSDLFKNKLHFISKDILQKEVELLGLKRCVVKYSYTENVSGKLSFKILFDERDSFNLITQDVLEETTNTVLPYISGVEQNNTRDNVTQRMNFELEKLKSQGICESISRN